jgi:hypothetical protein
LNKNHELVDDLKVKRRSKGMQRKDGIGVEGFQPLNRGKPHTIYATG